MVFVLYTTLAGARRLIGLAARGRDLEARFAVDAPARLTLAQDAEARAVVAISPHEGGVAVVRLDASPPIFGSALPAGPPLGAWTASLVPSRPCAPWDVSLWTLSDEKTGYILPFDFMVHVRGEARGGIIEGVLHERGHLVARYAAALQLPTRELANDLAARVSARYPGDPEMVQLPATRAAREGDWRTVRALLAPLDPAPMSDTAAQHHDHLLGVALLMTGDAGEARRILARGAARTGGWCDLAVALALAGVEGGPAPAPLYSIAQTLDASVRAADACLAAGDTRGARRALSSLAVREAHEVQTLARLCRAWLAEPDPAAIDTFAKRRALAAFTAAHAEKTPALRRELPFPGATWAPGTLDALAAEAREVLELERQATLKGEPEEGAIAK